MENWNRKRGLKRDASWTRRATTASEQIIHPGANHSNSSSSSKTFSSWLCAKHSKYLKAVANQMIRLSIALLSAVVAIAASGCTGRPKTSLPKGPPLDIPKDIRAIVYYKSNLGEQHAILFYNEVGKLVETVYLTNKVPPGDCLQPVNVPRTLTLDGWAVRSRVKLPLKLKQNSVDSRYYDVEILDEKDPTVVVAAASIGIPTVPSQYCKDP